jgi:hypothetical protein
LTNASFVLLISIFTDSSFSFSIYLSPRTVLSNSFPPSFYKFLSSSAHNFQFVSY